MKTIVISAQIQFDVPTGENADLHMVTEAINEALQRAGLTCEPQILPETVALAYEHEAENDDDFDGTEGQDRKNYSDDQDRDNYSVDDDDDDESDLDAPHTDYLVMENGEEWTLSPNQYEKLNNYLYFCDECKCYHIKELEVSKFARDYDLLSNNEN